MTSGAIPEPRRRDARRDVATVLLVVSIAAAGALLAWGASGQRRAVRELPERERRALYGRTLETLRTTCHRDQRPPGLEDFCRRQAELVVLFPECEASCRALLAPYRETPSR